MLAFEWILSFLLLGACVGFVAGLLGVGGGGILVPILTSIFLLQDVPVDKVVHLALGTSMACIIITSFSSLRAHNKKGAVIWKIVKTMSFGIIVGTFISTFIASYLNSFYLAIFFSLFMGVMAINMLKHKEEQKSVCNFEDGNVFVSSTGIGAISALVSIGGGSLTVPYLVKHNVDIKKAIGTSAAIGLPISLAGTLGYLVNGWNNDLAINYSVGFIYLPAAVLISITSFFTAPYGVKAAHYLPVQVLRKIFAFLLILLSVKMLLSVI
ncbi:sulfite exporter TauE/SafE family protein [Pseudoalteromonas rhizosphaerae]|uniref:sulfite exporter TauE/SafE family protein n=1 Tax=Pseudoalteromonas rhizosphaerae TaxID=2518973 RepID=UPI00123074CF|nr:sulfite exporter TauE/SafE family protein [Pseudoalteromonas rhizosphaerae]